MKDVARKGLLGELAETPAALFGRPFDEQYAALCYRDHQEHGVQVLLVTSRDTGRWIIPKGWPMKGRTPHEAAAVEAWEEGGVVGSVDTTPVGRFTYPKKIKTGTVPVTASVFLLRVDKLENSYREKSQRKREWVGCEEAARRVREPELKGILLSLRRKIVQPLDAAPLGERAVFPTRKKSGRKP